MRKNKVKEKLQHGNSVVGTFQGFNSPDLTEMCGYTGYDFVILDTEHGPMSAETCIPMICAAERSGVVPIIRVSENEKTYVLKALDVGAMGIIFPMINIIEDAVKAISLTRYIRNHNDMRTEFRGIVDVSRAAQYGMTAGLNSHMTTSNKEIMIILQMETAESVKNIEEILKLPEIDVILIGSLDLSQSLGYPGDVHHPVVQGVIKKAIKKIISAGKAVGMVIPSTDALQHWFDLRVSFFTYHQTYMFRDVLQKHVSEFHRITGH